MALLWHSSDAKYHDGDKRYQRPIATGSFSIRNQAITVRSSAADLAKRSAHSQMTEHTPTSSTDTHATECPRVFPGFPCTEPIMS